MTGIPTKFLTGRVFLPEDNVGIGQGVWDNTDAEVHRFGVGSGDVNPRYYPGIDKTGNMFLSYGTLIKSEYDGFGDNGFGFENGKFIVKMKGIIVLSIDTLGAELSGGLLQKDADPEYLPSHSGLSELLFPLFTDKLFIAQLNRPAIAYVDQDNDFRAYRAMAPFLFESISTFYRGGNLDVGLVRSVNSYGNFYQVLGSQPRITYHNVTKKCLGLLIEPTTTNLITYSFDLTSWDSVVGLTFTQEVNTNWANKGLSRPFYFIENNANSEHSNTKVFTGDITKPITTTFFYQARAFTGTRRFTVFTSDSSRNHLFGANFDAVSQGAPIFNINRLVGNGVVSTVDVEDVGDNIYRIRITGIVNPSGVTGSSSLKHTLASLGDTSGNSNLAFTPGANTGNWCLWNDAQVEQNPFSTSYIQTATTNMTRGADILRLNLSNFRYSNKEGLFEIKFKASSNILTDTIVFSLQNDDKTTRIDYYVSSIDKNAGTFTIGTKQYQPSINTVVNTNYATVNINKSYLSIPYTNMLTGLTKAVISGETGLKATISLITYE